MTPDPTEWTERPLARTPEPRPTDLAVLLDQLHVVNDEIQEWVNINAASAPIPEDLNMLLALLDYVLNGK